MLWYIGPTPHTTLCFALRRQASAGETECSGTDRRGLKIGLLFLSLKHLNMSKGLGSSRVVVAGGIAHALTRQIRAKSTTAWRS